MAEKSIVLNQKKYIMPKMDIEAYMNYLEIRDDIMGTEKKTGLYTKKQFERMLDCICDLYGNQFSPEELKAKESGISVAEIILEFASIETTLGAEVNKKVEKLQENFTNGR